MKLVLRPPRRISQALLSRAAKNIPVWPVLHVFASEQQARNILLSAHDVFKAQDPMYSPCLLSMQCLNRKSRQKRARRRSRRKYLHQRFGWVQTNIPGVSVCVWMRADCVYGPGFAIACNRQQKQACRTLSPEHWKMSKLFMCA